LAPHEHLAAIEVLDAFEKQAKIDPRMPGDEHPAIADLWVFETPSGIVRLPRLVVSYTIDDEGGFVDMCNLYRL
jgi:hypothetical protein